MIFKTTQPKYWNKYNYIQDSGQYNKETKNVIIQVCINLGARSDENLAVIGLAEFVGWLSFGRRLATIG